MPKKREGGGLLEGERNANGSASKKPAPLTEEGPFKTNSHSCVSFDYEAVLMLFFPQLCCQSFLYSKNILYTFFEYIVTIYC